jgi:hypothetical protein
VGRLLLLPLPRRQECKVVLLCFIVVYMDCLLRRRQGCEDRKLPRQSRTTLGFTTSRTQNTNKHTHTKSQRRKNRRIHIRRGFHQGDKAGRRAAHPRGEGKHQLTDRRNAYHPQSPSFRSAGEGSMLAAHESPERNYIYIWIVY